MPGSKKNRPHASLSRVPPNILDQAIAWAVKLHSGLAKPTDIEALAAWRAREPMHEVAWQHIQSVDQQLQAIPEEAGPLACQTLETAFHKRSMSRRQMLKIAVLVAVTGGAGLLITKPPWQRRVSAVTDVGLRRSLDLDDGSHLVLNSDTRIDIVYSPFRRTIRLTQGEVYIETGPDKASILGRREFWVETAHARMEAIGTRFAVRQEAGRTRLHVAEGAVAIQRANGRVIFRAGDTVWVDKEHPRLRRVHHPDHDPMAWIRGAIVARRMRLADFAAELNRHHDVTVRILGNAADLRVSGVFQLDGPDALERISNALASTLPVTVSREKDLIVVQ